MPDQPEPQFGRLNVWTVEPGSTYAWDARGIRMQDDKGHEAATLAAIRAKNLGIELPQWAYDAIVFEPHNAGVICDAVAVQSGLINPPMTVCPRPAPHKSGCVS